MRSELAHPLWNQTREPCAFTEPQTTVNRFQTGLEALRDEKAIAVIKKRLVRVALGNLGIYRLVGDGIFEFKIDYGPGYRVYFVQVGDVILLLRWRQKQSNQRHRASQTILD
jgi:putative addiction module killer protein